MIRLRKLLAMNIKTLRNALGFSQMKLAGLVGTASNYIAMIEAEKRFPTDKMIEKIATALRCEPYELFSVKPIQKDWQKALLAELSEVISRKLMDIKNIN